LIISTQKGGEGSFGDGWEYAAAGSSNYRPESRMLDMVRRRRWVRKMITSEALGASAIFNLDKSVVSGVFRLLSLLNLTQGGCLLFIKFLKTILKDTKN